MDELQRLVKALEQEMRERAARFGWTPSASPQLLRDASTRTAVEGLLEGLSADRPAPGRARLPEFRRAFELQPGSVGILMCGLDAADPGESYRSALWWTGLVRSEIVPSRRSDLHLFLVAPKGTSAQPPWQGRRSRIESDERFCRKFVWLPSSHPDQIEIGTFLDRTFLAQPWTGEAAEPRSLDPLERLADEASTKSLSPEETRKWIARLASLDGVQQIAEGLASILEGKE